MDEVNLINPTPDVIKNAAMNNPAGTKVCYGVGSSPRFVGDPAYRDTPAKNIMKTVSQLHNMGVVSMHHGKTPEGNTKYLFVVRDNKV